MLYLFTTANSFTSILTIKPTGEKDSSSVVDIAKDEGINQLFVVENNPSSFPRLLAETTKAGVQLCFGIKFTCCADIGDTSPESRDTEHKIVIFAKNGDGYSKGLMKMYTEAATTGYNGYPRLDEAILRSLWSDNLILAIPYYDSYYYNNSFYFKKCIFGLQKLNPVYFREDHGLPVDIHYNPKLTKFCEERGYPLIDSHTVYYRNQEDFKAYMTYRCIGNKSDLEVPNLDGFSSDQFYFKKYKC